MFISCFNPEIMKQMVIDAGFDVLETVIETQIEGKTEIPIIGYLPANHEYGYL